MTVSYSADVARNSPLTFFKILFRWKGSAYKLVSFPFCVFVLFYTLMSVLFRHLDDDSKRQFFRLANYIATHKNNQLIVGLSFAMGFFIGHVFLRFWTQFLAIPWPDRFAFLITSYIVGSQERPRMMRRTLIRYVNVSIITMLSNISKPVRRRFPTPDHYVDAKLLDEKERDILFNMPAEDGMRYLIPLGWVGSLIRRARKEKMLDDQFGYNSLMNEVDALRGNMGALFAHDYIPLPLVYIQLVYISLYAYFTSTLITRQFFMAFNLAGGDGNVTHDLAHYQHSSEFDQLKIGDSTMMSRFDIFVPAFTLVQFVVYIGWAKLSEILMNPFGNNDNCFNIHEIIDRHINVGYLIVDDLHSMLPPLTEDAFFDIPSADVNIPYTEASKKDANILPFIGSLNIHPTKEEEPIQDSNSSRNDDENVHDSTSLTHRLFGRTRRTTVSSNYEVSTATGMQVVSMRDLSSLKSRNAAAFRRMHSAEPRVRTPRSDVASSSPRGSDVTALLKKVSQNGL